MPSQLDKEEQIAEEDEYEIVPGQFDDPPDKKDGTSNNDKLEINRPYKSKNDDIVQLSADMQLQRMMDRMITTM